jgi:UDP-N-acetylmuramoyl-tripeptide--D-alanyl-D-alanine ligase
MRARTLASIAETVDGDVLGDRYLDVGSLSTDSRTVEPGSLFVALRGEMFDGHDFIGEAFARGASAVLVRRGVAVDGPAVTVDDTGRALLDLAADERNAFAGRMVAITGANGKTSTKDMTAAVSATRYKTHASPSSFNNEVGVPLTLLGVPPGTEVVVAEVGARHMGDVRLLWPVVDPSIVVVTNVGVAHIEMFGSWEAIVEASAEPVDELSSDGVVILNADDPVVAGFGDRTRARVVTFGRADHADVRAVSVELDHDGRATFDVVTGTESTGLRLAVPGEHMVPNALAAAAVGRELGIPLAAAAAALAEASITRWRMEVRDTPAGVRVVNDAYNANPESVAAALRTARWMASDGRLVAVLGPMAELGPIARDEHERVGELAARLRVDRLIAVGPDAEPIVLAGIREGVEPENAVGYDKLDEALADLLGFVRRGDVVLVKGSRIAGLEELADRAVEALS